VEAEEEMNPYFQNWNYGYTLGPPSEQTKGAYTTYEQQQGGGSGQVKQEPQQSWGQQQGRSDRSSMPPPQAQKFVAAGSQPIIKQEQSPSIGPNKPQAVVNPSQYGDTPAAAASLFKLHELAVQNRLVEKYETVKEEQMGASPQMFKVNLILGTETYQGQGPSVKMAKQIAAVQALKETKYQSALEQRYSMAGGGRKPIGVTATSELHELAVKKGVRIEFKFLEPFNFEFKHQMRMWSKDEMRGNYRVQLNVAGYEFFGQADLPQTAKHNAASQAMAVVKALPDPSGVAQVVNPPLPGAPKAEPVSVPISMDGKNVNMALNEIAMCNGCVPEWTMIGEQGPPHQKTFTWQLTLGEFSTTGTGPNKKLARNVAAEQMMAQLPEEWKSKRAKTKKSGAGTKRPGFGSRGGPSPKKKQQAESEDGKVVITADNPVSCLYEYAKKVKIADPEFSCIAENLLETWQKANQTFKKIEYTMQLKIDGKTYLASSNQKKAAKQATAAEAWNAIRATLL